MNESYFLSFCSEVEKAKETSVSRIHQNRRQRVIDPLSSDFYSYWLIYSSFVPFSCQSASQRVEKWEIEDTKTIDYDLTSIW